ncbi:hypothetical protein Q73_02075 [Bacillus coahuilensis m2-6]|uniref:hypothetical protein n=1 Tax=Bacillus coahuilensis TaxID=408580 RepID=UPI0001850A7F|nr:hypothetical protein [Bacillus coahuilensis]KUP09688.1 hypothetical protein Q73_02075 [Bacillus coahuilensis m2-6]
MSSHLADRKVAIFTLFQHIEHDQVFEIVDYLPDAIQLMDTDRIYFPNKAARQLLDCNEKEKLIGVTLSKILHHSSSSPHTNHSILSKFLRLLCSIS